MVAPDFSEFTFGYAVTRHIEDMIGGRVAVPNHPTQVAEANLGYDVDFLSHGVPMVIQYKRSSVMKRRDCIEFSSPFASWFVEHRPFFRMHLHRNDGFRQHMALRLLQRICGVQAWYCTSNVVNKDELDGYYRTQNVFSACTFIDPSSILLPDITHHHFVSFHPNLPFKLVFSEHGMPFRDKGDLFEGLRMVAGEEPSNVIERLREAIKALDKIGPDGLIQGERRIMYERRETTTAALEIVEDIVGEVPRDYLRRTSKDMLFYRPERPPERRELGLDSFGGSVIKRLAYEAYRLADAYLVSMPRDRLG